jgi:hypothetical protein
MVGVGTHPVADAADGLDEGGVVAELAPQAADRDVREWLAAQAAGGYVTYDPGSGRYTLPPEQAMALADRDKPGVHGRRLRRGRLGEAKP